MSETGVASAPVAAPDHGGADPTPGRGRRWAHDGAVLALPGVVVLVVMAWWNIDRDAWFDEAISIAATYQLRETFDRTAYTMATYYAQLTLWTKPGVALWWVRLLSVVHAVAAMLVVGRLAVRCFGRRVAVWASLFLGASYMMVRYAHEARSFAFVVLLVAVAWLATDHLVEDPTHRGWLACHLVVGVLAPLTHGMAVFALAWQAVALAASGAGRRVWYATAPGWAAAVVGTGILYQMGGSELGTPAGTSDVRFVAEFLESFHGGTTIRGEVVAPWLLLFALSLYGLALGLRRWRTAPVGLARFRSVMAPAWGLGGVAAILVLDRFRPGVHVRYAVAAAPGLALGWALAAEHLRRWFLARRSPLRTLGRAPLVALAVVAVLLVGQVRYHESPSTAWTRLVEHIARESRPGDAVVVNGPHRDAFDVAWSRLEDPPELGSVGRSTGLGVVRRFDDDFDLSQISWQVILSQRLWIVERRAGSLQELYGDFVAFYLEPQGFYEVDTRDFNEYRLHLFVNPRADQAAELLEDVAAGEG